MINVLPKLKRNSRGSYWHVRREQLVGILIDAVVQIVEGHLFVDPSATVGYVSINAGSAALAATKSPSYDASLNVSRRIIPQRTHQGTSAVALQDYSFI